MAKFQTMNITHISNRNEALVRTHHPELFYLQDVWVSESIFGRPIWVPAKEVEAAGRPSIFCPADHPKYLPHGIIPPRNPSIFEINPRRFPIRHDLDTLRMPFPQAVGIEIWVAGYVIILFDKMSDVKDAYNRIWPLELAGLRVYFDIACYECTAVPIEHGIGIGAEKEYHTRWVSWPKAQASRWVNGHHCRDAWIREGFQSKVLWAIPNHQSITQDVRHG